MNPNYTFDEFKFAISEERYADAAEHAANLLDWLNKGGFKPSGFPENGNTWLEAYARSF